MPSSLSFFLLLNFSLKSIHDFCKSNKVHFSCLVESVNWESGEGKKERYLQFAWGNGWDLVSSKVGQVGSWAAVPHFQLRWIWSKFANGWQPTIFNESVHMCSDYFIQNFSNITYRRNFAEPSPFQEKLHRSITRTNGKAKLKSHFRVWPSDLQVQCGLINFRGKFLGKFYWSITYILKAHRS